MKTCKECGCNENEYCDACFKKNAIEAGIPESVVLGKTKLTDHFSKEYIRSQCKQPDIDICSECGEHSGFDENGSECCGANPVDPDPDIDMER